MSHGELQHIRIGETTLAYRVVRSRRRHKTVQITVDPVDGVWVAAPASATPERLEEILRRRAPWIIKRVEESRNGHVPTVPRQFVSGESLKYLGRQARLKVAEVKGLRSPEVRLLPGRFEVKVRAGLAQDERRQQIARALERWYRDHAAKRIVQRVATLGERLGVKPTDVLVRHQEARWGSCSSQGVLRFNWRIVMAPIALVDYVVAHELCHLLHPNHKPAFWTRLATLIPDYELRKQRLRAEGARYRL